MIIKKGFTLIELLIVMAILGILATLGVGNFQSSRIKAKDTARKQDLQTIAKSLEAYVNDYKTYPSASSGKIQIDTTTLNWGDQFVDVNGTVYAAKLPQDPGGYNYYYVRQSTTSYYLYAHLENSQDSALITPAITGCGGTEPSCNYRISSSNL